MINKAVINLHGGWDDFPEDSKSFIEDAIRNGNYEQVYLSTNEEEKLSKDMLIGFEQDYPGVTKASKLDEILKNLKKKNKKYN